jgi:hypothetical protein
MKIINKKLYISSWPTIRASQLLFILAQVRTLVKGKLSTNPKPWENLFRQILPQNGQLQSAALKGLVAGSP